MRLSSIDITKGRKLSLKDAKLPSTELKLETTTPIKIDKPPTDEETVYSKLVAKNPLLEKLVDNLGLVSSQTGESLKKVKHSKNFKPHPEPEIKPKEVDKDRLIALSKKVIESQNNFTKDEIIERIKEATNVTQERADRGFNLILDAGAIKEVLGDRYYLTGSTPF